MASARKNLLLLSQNGPDRILFAVLDNLIGQRRLPAMVAISIGSGGGDAQGSERALEYNMMSGLYTEWVEKEVLPRVEAETHVKLTNDPNGRATMGVSSGGSSALAMAWYHPALISVFDNYAANYKWQCR